MKYQVQSLFFFFKSWNLRFFLEIFYSKKFFKILVNKWCWISILQKWLLKMTILMVFNLLLTNWKGSKNEGINHTKFTYGWRITVKICISTTKIRFSIDSSNKFVSFMGNFHIQKRQFSVPFLIKKEFNAKMTFV